MPEEKNRRDRLLEALTAGTLNLIAMVDVDDRRRAAPRPDQYSELTMLRTEVLALKSSLSAMASLLDERGIIPDEDYLEKCAEFTHLEAQRLDELAEEYVPRSPFFADLGDRPRRWKGET